MELNGRIHCPQRLKPCNCVRRVTSDSTPPAAADAHPFWQGGEWVQVRVTCHALRELACRRALLKGPTLVTSKPCHVRLPTLVIRAASHQTCSKPQFTATRLSCLLCSSHANRCKPNRTEPNHDHPIVAPPHCAHHQPLLKQPIRRSHDGCGGLSPFTVCALPSRPSISESHPGASTWPLLYPYYQKQSSPAPAISDSHPPCVCSGPKGGSGHSTADNTFHTPHPSPRSTSPSRSHDVRQNARIPRTLARRPRIIISSPQTDHSLSIWKRSKPLE